MSNPAGLRTAAWVAAVLAWPLVASAQSVESDLTPEAEGLVRNSSHYVLPDLGDKTLGSTQITDRKDRFSLKLGLALLPMDYTSFEQDAASKAQVGNERDEYEARSLRVMLRGHFELFRRWDYVASYEYKGFANERLLSPFFTSRNVGVQLSNTMLDQRATWAVGWYNDWWVNGDSFSGSGNDFAARVTALPVWTEDSSRYVHVAASVRYYGADDDQLRFRGQPASHVAEYYVDTGKIAGDHAWNTGLEPLWNVDGYSLLGEYVTSSVSSRATGNPDFSGYYLTAGWVVTGEHRPYDRKAGYARRILPQGRWGAWEIIGRYGHVDLDDQGAHGGTMDGWWAGLNWWATRRWKASVGYGDIDLDRAGLQGNTKTLLTRIQWIY